MAELARPDLGGPPNDEELTDDWAASVVPVGDDQAIVLYAGGLTRWDVRTGARLGEPVPLRAGEAVGARRRAALLAYVAGRRPGHPDQAAVVLPDSTVQVWSLEEQRAVARFDVNAALTVGTTLFHPDGTRLAVKEKNGSVTVRWVDDPQRTARRIPAALGADLLGFTPGEKSLLVTVDSGTADRLRLWNLDTAQQVALLSAPIGSVYTMRGDEVGVFADGYARRLRLDPRRWFSSLCALASRPYTADEIGLLRERHAPLSPPCP